MTSLPLDARQASSPRQSLPLPTGVGRTATPPRPKPRPIKSGLLPSQAELSGRINHDPAVNMSLEIPPSPLTSTRPPISNGESHATSGAGSRSPSPSYPFPSSSTDNHASSRPLNPDLPNEGKVFVRPVSTAEHHKQQVHSQSASIVSRSSDNSNHDGPRSPNQEYTEFPTRPARARHADRSSSRGSHNLSYHLPRTNSLPRGVLSSNVDERQDYQGKHRTVDTLMDEDLQKRQPPLPQPLRIGTAVDDWGNAIFQEIDQSIHDSKTIAAPSSNQAYSHHASKLSDSSSIYSSANAGHRHSTKKLSIDSKSVSPAPSTLPSSTPSENEEQHRQSPELVSGTRRGSDASSHQTTSNSHGVKEGHHRSTADLGDFYDSYWRQSNQAPLGGPGWDTGKPHPASFSASRSAGEVGKEGKRPGQMDLTVPTITEVPSPLPSPIASPMPGTAL